MITTRALAQGRTLVVSDVIAPGMVRVVDGDTYWMFVQGLFRQIHYVEIRLAGWDTPERRGPTTFERSQAQVAADYATTWFGSHPQVKINTLPDPEKYGRWLGEVYSGQSVLGEELAALKLAVPYQGSGQRWRDVHGR